MANARPLFLVGGAVQRSDPAADDVEYQAFTGDRLIFKERGTDPGGTADQGKLYGKDAAGITELFWQDSGGTVRQLTPPSGGASTSNEATNTATTTDATQTTVRTIALADNTGYWIKAEVRGELEGGAKRCGYSLLVYAFRTGGGGATFLGNVKVMAIEETVGDEALDATFTTSTNDVLLRVTGLVATTIAWTATSWYNGT